MHNNAPENEQRLEKTVLLYRRLGDVLPESWIEAKTNSSAAIDFSATGVEDDLGYATLMWDLKDVEDSTYEIRAQSKCIPLAGTHSGLSIYNTEPIIFILDRKPPAIYGTQVHLSGSVESILDDEYFIYFSEPLYCKQPFVFDLSVTLSSGNETTQFSHEDGNLHAKCVEADIQYRFDKNALRNNPITSNTQVAVTIDGVQDYARNTAEKIELEPHFWSLGDGHDVAAVEPSSSPSSSPTQVCAVCGYLCP